MFTGWLPRFRANLPSFKSNTFREPFIAPDTTHCSSESKHRHSMGDLFWPNVQMLDTFPTRQIFTLKSSPPVARTWFDFGPKHRQFTRVECATNSWILKLLSDSLYMIWQTVRKVSWDCARSAIMFSCLKRVAIFELFFFFLQSSLMFSHWTSLKSSFQTRDVTYTRSK